MADEPKLTGEMAFIDAPHAPDLFADGATGFFILNGTVRVTLESARVNHVSSPGPVSRVVIGRLVMPAQAAAALAVGLFDFLSQHGVEVPGLLRANQPLQ